MGGILPTGIREKPEKLMLQKYKDGDVGADKDSRDKYVQWRKDNFLDYSIYGGFKVPGVNYD